MKKETKWIKVLDDASALHENRVMTVTANHTDICLSRFEGEVCALDNKCPHQGGPLGEGSIENGLLRCPWHGWDYHPCTGKAPGFDDGVETVKVKTENNKVYVALETEDQHEATVSDIMVETMVNMGVNTVFGMVGHSNLGLADAFRRREEQGNLRYFAIRHEGAAAFAASAYGKLTGKPAACFAIAGPGSTNMYTGMWDANVDRAPMLALTGQVATQVVGTGNFQEVDLVQAFSTVAGFNHRVQHDSRHAELMTLAIKHALLNRTVSHLTFPDEVQVLPAGEEKAQTAENRITSLKISPPEEAMQKAEKMLLRSKRPVIIVGHGSRFSMENIIRLAEMLKAPILTTFKAKGQIPDNHPLAGGVLGRSGTPVASWLMNESDLLLVLGASFSNHTGITDKKPLIQVDTDPLALAKFHAVDAQVLGDVAVTVEKFRKDLKGKTETTDQTGDVTSRWKIWRAEKAKRLKEYHGNGLGAIHVFDALNKLAPDNAVMTVDVGNNAYSFGRYYESKNNTFLMSGYLGSIGFALPAALGAWAAAGNERPVIAVAGDGGIAQYLAEITTLVKYQMNVKVILLNNNELGKISKEQRSGHFEVWKTQLTNPDFASFASSCGALGLKADRPENLMKKMEELFAHDGPALLEIKTDVSLL
jgi:thiamine pyrophosphate-dependent acetolactate synthase large subunit-like protein/nitrite reductase/ring-hydroxylating ferredoxin subunit